MALPGHGRIKPRSSRASRRRSGLPRILGNLPRLSAFRCPARPVASICEELVVALGSALRGPNTGENSVHGSRHHQCLITEPRIRGQFQRTATGLKHFDTNPHNRMRPYPAQATWRRRRDRIHRSIVRDRRLTKPPIKRWRNLCQLTQQSLLPFSRLSLTHARSKLLIQQSIQSIGPNRRSIVDHGFKNLKPPVITHLRIVFVRDLLVLVPHVF